MHPMFDKDERACYTRYMKQMPKEYEEPKGFRARPGYVKTNPLNNAIYLERTCALFPEWESILRTTDTQLEFLVPGYNIVQIKEKFDTLRYYFDVPEDTPERIRKIALNIANTATLLSEFSPLK